MASAISVCFLIQFLLVLDLSFWKAEKVWEEERDCARMRGHLAAKSSETVSARVVSVGGIQRIDIVSVLQARIVLS